MKTEDIINALAKPLGAAALNGHGHPADAKTVIDKAIKSLNLLNEHRFAANWSLSELRNLFGEYGAPAGDRGAVRPDQFAAWVVGLVRELHNRTFSQHERIVDGREVVCAKALDAAEAENSKPNNQITTLKTMLANVGRQITTLKTMLVNVEGQRDAAETENLHLREEIVSRDNTIAELKEKLEQQTQPADTPTQTVLWNRSEQFGLPPGYTINNPANLSPDQIGEGYRIATTADDTNLPHDFFSEESNHWILATRVRGTFSAWVCRTYRVPADRPLPPLENDKP